MGLVLLVRRQRHLPEGRGAARGGARRCPTTCSWSRPTRRSWRRSRCAASGTSRRTSSRRPRRWPRCAASPTRSWRRSSRRTPRQRVRMVRLGQNFLADTNLLGAIVREAELGPRRRGARGRRRGGGADRGARAARSRPCTWSSSTSACATALEAVAARARERRAALRRRDADRSRRRSTRRRPGWSPTCRTRSRRRCCCGRSPSCPGVASWTLMVQREIADRLRAAPGSRTYGSPSVLVQLACEVRLLRAVDRAVFTPRPRVDSALIGLRRTGPAAAPGGRSRWCATGSPTGASRWRARSSTRGRASRRGRAGARGHRACRRTRGPSSWRRQQFVALAAELEGSRTVTPARAGEAQPVPVSGGRRARTACTSCARSSARCCSATGSRSTERGGRGGRGGLRRRRRARIWSAWRSRRCARAAGGRRRCGSRSTSGSRSPPGSAAAARTRRRCCASPPGSWRSAGLAAGLGADVPSQLDPRVRARLGRGRGGRAACRSPGEFAVVLIPDDDGLSTAESTREADALGLGRSAEELDGSAGGCARPRRRARRRSTTPSCSTTTSSRRRSRCARRSPRRSRRSRRSARRGAGTGSGPTAFGLFEDIVAADAPRRSCRPATRARSSRRRSGSR